MDRGKFIVIYGANNLGKSSQTVPLVEKLNLLGIKASNLKYPIYDLEPTGPRLNRILRQGAEPYLSPAKIQKIFAKNREDYEPTLVSRLKSGEWIIGEDYTGTGIAWGIAKGVKLSFLEDINYGLLKEDLAILLTGSRFSSGIERGHIHEDRGSELWMAARNAHEKLAVRYGWEIINGNLDEKVVHREIWDIIKKRFFSL